MKRPQHRLSARLLAMSALLAAASCSEATATEGEDGTQVAAAEGGSEDPARTEGTRTGGPVEANPVGLVAPGGTQDAGKGSAEPGEGAEPPEAVPSTDRGAPKPKQVPRSRQVPRAGNLDRSGQARPANDPPNPGQGTGHEGHGHEGTGPHPAGDGDGPLPAPGSGTHRDGARVPGAGPMAGEKDPNAKLSIEFGQEKHNFGNCRQGDVLEHTFELFSVGENPVKIRQASPTCGCTVTGVETIDAEGNPQIYKYGDSIAPGTKVLVKGKLDTASKKNKTQVRINVYTNDVIGLTQLVLAADIEPFLTVTPPFVNLGDIKEGDTKTQTIDIRTSRGEPIGLEMDETNPIKVPPGMNIEVEPVNPGEDGRSSHWRAVVTVGEGAKEGTIGYQVRLVSDVLIPDALDKTKEGAPAYYKATSSVSGRILGPLSYTPQFVSLGLVRPGQRVPRNVKIISHDPEFDLSGVKVELQGEQGKPLPWAEYFTTSIKPATGLANAIDVQLRLEGLPDGADGSFRGVMVIKTGHEAKPELSVRFSGVCRSGVKRPTPAGGGK